MILRKPTIKDEQLMMDYLQEHYDNNEKEIHGSNLLSSMKYDEWIEKLQKDEYGENKEWGISETYILVDENKIKGIVNIRYNPIDEIVAMYGHIGYGVRPTERRKGIATYMLKEALKKCKEKGLVEVTIGCNKNNIGSSKTIIKNNGILSRETTIQDTIKQYYKIKLN